MIIKSREFILKIASDSCDIILNGEDVPTLQTNPNKLTQPDIIFYWEIILLVLHLGVAGTSIILQRLQKEVTFEICFMSSSVFDKIE